MILHSMWPFIWGCAVLLYFKEVSNFRHNIVHKVVKNLLSRSNPMELGIPCSLTTSWKNSFATCGASEVFQQEIKCAIFENMSTTTNTEPTLIYVRGSPNTNSIPKSSHLAFGVGKGWYKLVFWIWPFATRQTWQLLMIVATSFHNYGQ